MSCRNFNFDDCLDDSVEELLDRDTSQPSAQKRAEAHDKQLVAIAALAPIAENDDAGFTRSLWSGLKARNVFWQTALAMLVCVVIVMIAMQPSSNVAARGPATGFGSVER